MTRPPAQLAALLALLVASSPSPSPAQAHAPEPSDASGILRLKYAEFDPLRGAPAVPPALRAGGQHRLWIVQLAGRPTEEARRAIRAAGGEVHGYLPDEAYVVRMPVGDAARVNELPAVRWVGAYHPAYRLEPVLLAEHVAGEDVPVRRYNLVVVDERTDKERLAERISAIGGVIEHRQPGSILLEATLTGTQLLAAARLDEVLWIDRATRPEEDMNHLRIQAGANYVEALGGYTGSGIRGHVYEGIEVGHPDFTNTPINVDSCGTASSHGHATAGIVFGNGTSHPNARGLAPDAQALYTTYSCVAGGLSRWQVVQNLVTVHDVMFTTASWGNPRTTRYTSISADTDDIVFDHDIFWTQSFGNSTSQNARPEAWAKNVVAAGGIAHFDNADPADDSYLAGGAAHGPAADGRIKPELVGYYFDVWTSDLTGSAGYSPTNHYAAFGGVSATTPMLAGHAALAIQMFTDHIFNNAPRVPGGTRFQNRPHFSTLKALLLANARQYPFTAASIDNLRMHQGWGMPDVRTMYDNRARMFLVDETDLLVQGQTRSYPIAATGGEPELKVVLCYGDPAGNPAAAVTRINDLSLRVVAPSGTTYQGNQGLLSGNYSTPGGSADDRNTVEAVFVRHPEAGSWRVDVVAMLIAQDGHVETPAVDADYGLAVTFGDDTGTYTPFGSGCPGTAGVPSYLGSRVPRVDSFFHAGLASARAGAPAALLIGVSDRSWAGGNLPFGLGPLGAPLCSLLVSTEIVISTTTGAAGAVEVPVPIPNVAVLIGKTVYQQFIVLDAGANASGAALSDADEIGIGR